MRMGNDGKPHVSLQPRRRHSRRHLDRPADRGALRRQADVVDPHAAPHRRPLRQRDRDHHQGPPRPVRRHPRGADRRGHGGVRDRGPLSAPARPDGRQPGMAVRAAQNASAGGRMDDIHQSISAAIAAFARGEIVVVTDDDDRENEGDLFVAASLCTPEKMAFIIRNTSGIVCAPVGPDDAKRLHLDPMVALNDAPLGTAFTVSVDVAPRPHHRHLGRGAQQYRARARQRQQRRRRFRAARPCLSAGREGRRRADALRPYRGLRRSLPARRPAAGRRALPN